MIYYFITFIVVSVALFWILQKILWKLKDLDEHINGLEIDMRTLNKQISEFEPVKVIREESKDK